MYSLNDETTRLAAVLYIQRVLAKGHTLAKVLLQGIKLQAGTVSVLSPHPLDSKQVLQFESGHFPQEPVSATIGGVPGTISPITDSDDQITNLVCGLLSVPDSVCLIENPLAGADDKWLQRAKSHVITHQSEILHAVFGGSHTEDEIAAAIREARGIPVFVGAVGSLTTAGSRYIRKNKAITTSTLESFAESARFIFVGAFDGEGYVIWEMGTV